MKPEVTENADKDNVRKQTVGNAVKTKVDKIAWVNNARQDSDGV